MDLQDHLHVINNRKGENMQEINLENTKIIIGGAVSFSGAVISAIRGYVNTIFSIGQAVGGAIRRISSGNLCKF